MNWKFPIALVFLYSHCGAFADIGSDYEYIKTASQRLQEAGIDEDLEFIIAAIENQKKLSLSRTDQIDQTHLKGREDQFLEGYIQALIDANYYEYNVIVMVKDRKVVLYQLPNNLRLKNSILAFVRDLPDIISVEEGQLTEETKKQIEKEYVSIPRVKGIWFPETTVIFPPLIASPFDPLYSVGYRSGDQVLGNNIISISFGDTFPIFRWHDIGPLHGDLQIDIAAGVWGDFNMNPKNSPEHEWAELITTDYILSIPLSYAFDQWSFRGRVYHISSHLGDEFMCNNPEVQRVNPSFEAIDFITAYQLTTGTRIYFGPGFVFHSDDSYQMKPLYFEYGTEIRFMTFKSHYHHLYGSPFFALDVQNWQTLDFKFTVTVQLGYELSKLQGAGRKVRFFGQYFHGHSEGQFFYDTTNYWAIRASYGF
ncbi:MAG: DUF1207 domain-containing protein [Chlamydiae bacterium]|nr:DUF1207 domain-containing protein [Chlamydiota bacterium]